MADGRYTGERVTVIRYSGGIVHDAEVATRMCLCPLTDLIVRRRNAFFGRADRLSDNSCASGTPVSLRCQIGTSLRDSFLSAASETAIGPNTSRQQICDLRNDRRKCAVGRH